MAMTPASFSNCGNPNRQWLASLSSSMADSGGRSTISATQTHFARRWRRGVITANLEYRRVGQPGGGWPGTFEDVAAGIKAASEHVGGAAVVVGHSAGGHLALRLASESVPLKAVVALAPVANLRLAYELESEQRSSSGIPGRDSRSSA
jgi:acetyl esterase/lipase